jgi:hypothetical protein
MRDCITINTQSVERGRDQATHFRDIFLSWENFSFFFRPLLFQLFFNWGQRKKMANGWKRKSGEGGGGSALSTPYEEECKQTVGLITNYVEWMAKQHEGADHSHRLWQFNLWDSHRGTGQQPDGPDGEKEEEGKRGGGGGGEKISKKQIVDVYSIGRWIDW